MIRGYKNRRPKIQSHLKFIEIRSEGFNFQAAIKMIWHLREQPTLNVNKG